MHIVSQYAKPGLPLQKGAKGLKHALIDPDGALHEGHRQASQGGGDDIGPRGEELCITLLVEHRQALDLYKKSICDDELDAASAKGLFTLHLRELEATCTC